MFKKIKNRIIRFFSKNNLLSSKLDSNKSFTPNIKRTILILVGIASLIFLISGIIVLAIVKPNFEVSQIKLKRENISIERINTYSQYPELSFTNNSRVTFTNGSKFIEVKSVKLLPEHFNEGENTISIQEERDYFLFKLLSKEKELVNVDVDRIAPKFEIQEYTKDSYLLLEDFNLGFKGELGSDIYDNEELIHSVDTTDQEILLKVQDGQNTKKLYAKDKFGNKTELTEISFKAFVKPNYSVRDCDGVVIPLAPELRLGLSGYNPNVPNVYFSGKPQSVINEFNANSDLCNESKQRYNIFIIKNYCFSDSS